MSTIYSTAFNQLGGIAGEPDPCTGIFSKKITLGKITGNYGLGPHLSFDLQFNPLDTIGGPSSTTNPFGIGWSLGLPSYTYDTESATGQLVLLNGQCYVMKGATPTLDGYTLKDIQVSRSGSTINVLYATGEQLTYSVDSSNNGRIQSIKSRSGRGLNFNYFISGSVVELTDVTDDVGNTLVSFAYNSSQNVVTFFKSDADSYTVVLDTTQSQLETVSFSNGLYSASLKYKIINNGQVPVYYLSDFSDSNGLVEQVEYSGYILMPSGAPISSTYVVGTYTSSPGLGLPTSTTTYDYGVANPYFSKSRVGQNYLGYGTNVQYESNTDTLLNYPNEYYYSNRVTHQIDENNSIVEVYTYDKFHSQIQLTTTQNGGENLKTQSVTYYADESLGADDVNQSTIYTRPKDKTTRYTNPDATYREETTSYDWDLDFGTLTSKVDKTGVTTNCSYYPAEGEEGACPADPNGFGTHLKAKVVTPAPDLPSAPTRYRTYTYGSQPCFDNANNYYLAVESETEADGEGNVYHVRAHSYYDTTDSFTAGRKQKIVDTCVTPETSTSLDTTRDFTYEQDPTSSRVTATTAITGFDGTIKKQAKTSSYLSGLQYSSADVTTGSSSLKVDFAYDQLHRVISKTMCQGSQFEATCQYAYTNATTATPRQEITTEVSGAQSRDSFDGQGNLIRSERLDADGMVSTDTSLFYTTDEYVYDQLSRKVSDTSYDYLAGDAPGTPSISTSTTYAYDIWGELTSTQYASGYIAVQEDDPVAMATLSYVVIDGIQQQTVQTYYDLFQNVLTQTSIEADGKTPYATTTSEYDGFGRKVSESDPLGNTSQWTYDFFDRETEAIRADGSREVISYAPHSDLKLSASLSYLDDGEEGEGTLMGNRAFDGLNRITSIQIGQRGVQYTYSDNSPRPSKAITPEQSVYSYAAQSELGYLIVQNNLETSASPGVSEPELKYGYDAKTGNLLTASSSQTDSEDYSEQTNTYYLCGKICTQKLDYCLAGETGSGTASFSYSLGEKGTSWIDVLGNTHKISYSDTGVKSSYSINEQISVAYLYDGSGRLIQTVSKDSDGKTLSTDLTYDTFGREVTRTLTTPDGVKQQQVLDYNLNGQVTSRSWARDGASVRNESYKYDSLSRLETYACSGSELPDMPNGYSLNSAQFAFDVCGNVATAEYGLTNAQQQPIDSTSRFTYSADDPSQLIEISNNNISEWNATLQYDANGNMIADQQGLNLAYNGRNQLLEQTNSVGDLSSGQLWYDASGLQIAEKSSGDANVTVLCYVGDQLANEIQGTAGATWLDTDGRLICDGADPSREQLLGGDQQGSIVKVYDNGNVTDRCYAPYGYSATTSKTLNDVLVGYTGEKQCRVTDYYLLGNGYRGYNPTLGRFSGYDSASPFGEGGGNGYMYCVGDPVNSSDPSGHTILSIILIVKPFRRILRGIRRGAAAAAEDNAALGALRRFDDHPATRLVRAVDGAADFSESPASALGSQAIGDFFERAIPSVTNFVRRRTGHMGSYHLADAGRGGKAKRAAKAVWHGIRDQGHEWSLGMRGASPLSHDQLMTELLPSSGALEDNATTLRGNRHVTTGSLQDMEREHSALYHDTRHTSFDPQHEADVMDYSICVRRTSRESLNAGSRSDATW